MYFDFYRAAADAGKVSLKELRKKFKEQRW